MSSSWELAAIAAELATPLRHGERGIARRRQDRLKALVRYAYRYSPYYRRVFDKLSLRPGDIRGEQDLHRLPLLSSRAVREHRDEIASTEFDPPTVRWRKTTGSSGLPLTFPVARMENEIEPLLWLKGYRHYGLRPWHLQAKIANPSRIPSRPHLPQRLGWFRRHYLSAAEWPADKVSWLRRERPHALFSLASVLNEVAMLLEDEDACLRIPLVFSASEMLWPPFRARIQERIRGQLIDTYGAVESGPMGWECNETGIYHVPADYVIVELLDESDAPAPSGRVVCTVLWRRAFPLIRYDLGDLAEWHRGSCDCGRTTPCLGALRGRRQDMIRLTDGTWITALTMKRPVVFAPGVKQFQFVQESACGYVARVVAGPEFGPVAREQIESAYRHRFGDRLTIRIDVVSDIQTPPESKFATLLTLERLAQINRRAARGDAP